MTTVDVLFATMLAVATATVGVLNEAPPAALPCSQVTEMAAPPSTQVPLCSPDEAVVHGSWDAFAD